jgi:LmbE family N-acetylglucosaminyl deacetylase
MTDGRYAFRDVLGIDVDPTPEELKEIRKEEVKRAVKILGVKENSLVFLDFADGTLAENKEKAEERVIEILNKCSPDEVYIPYKRDGHPDHRATHRIVRNSVKKLGIQPTLYQYQITHRYARVGPLLESFINFLRNNKVRVDISKFLSLKELAIKEFGSEITAISTRQHKPVIGSCKKFLKNVEVFIIEK